MTHGTYTKVAIRDSDPSLTDLLTTVESLRARFSPSLPQPFRVGEDFYNVIKARIASGYRSGRDKLPPFKELDPVISGCRVVLDDRIPKDEMRIFYEDSDGNLQLVKLTDVE